MTTIQTGARALTRPTHTAALSLEEEILRDPSRFRVLTGDRPTGHLHLGHYFGSLQNRVHLQDKGAETFIVIADYQVITDRDDAGPISERVLSMLADYLAIGLDPARSIIFRHSAVPALNQLMLPFLSLVTDAELRRNPTVKAELAATHGRPLSGLLLTYPVHQAADILFCRANLVPVGQDQLPHLEQTRSIARRFDERFGRGSGVGPVFPLPSALLSETPNLLGTDGHKMSKSRSNTIELRMTADQTAAVIRGALTDSDRHITYNPAGRPGVATLIDLVALSTGREPFAVAEQVGHRGAARLKALATEAVNERFAAIRARRERLVADPAYLRSVLAAGNSRANAIADQTLVEVHDALGMGGA